MTTKPTIEQIYKDLKDKNGNMPKYKRQELIDEYVTVLLRKTQIEILAGLHDEKKTNVCSQCGGSGVLKYPHGDSSPCDVCGGKGEC